MSEGLTGILAIAASGMIQGQGLRINPELITEIDNFNQNQLVKAIQDVLNSDNQPLIDLVSLLPNFMSGLTPSGISITGINNKNLVASILTQAQKIFPDVQKFTAIFQQAEGYVSRAYEFKKTLTKAQNTGFADLGFQYQNYTDVLTGGISSQFDTEYLPVLAKEFLNLGTMFNIKEITKLDDPGILIQTMIKQGFGSVNNLESKARATGIDLNSVDEFDKSTLIEILQTIQGNDLLNIITTTGFKPHRPDQITDLSKVLVAENVFSPDAIKAFSPTGTLSDLSRKLGNVGGSFEDAAALNKFYSNLSIKKFTKLNAMKSMMPASMVAALGQNIGTGTGENNSLTMLDVLGSVAGTGYINNIREINVINNFLSNKDSNIINLISKLKEPTSDITTIQPLIDSINADPALQQMISDGNRFLINCAERLKLEIQNLATANIIPEDITANTDTVLSFVNSLHSIGQSSTNIGSRTLLESLVTDDVYGEAIEASILEGQNLNNFSAIGLDPKTKLN